MGLELKHIEYYCMGKDKGFSNFSAKVIVSVDEEELSGEGTSRFTSEGAAWNAVTAVLSPLNIIDTKKIKDMKVLPYEKRGMIVSCSYDGKKIAGYSRNQDRPIATAEALVNLYERIREQK